MKSLIVSDLHGSFNPSWIKDAKEAGIERFVCLGDYDEPKVLRQILDLKMKKIVLIGNHDYHLCRGINLTSPELDNDVDYYDLWEDTPESKLVIDASFGKSIRKKGLIVGTKICESISGKKVVYVHGGLYSSSPKLNNNLDPYLWARFLHPDYRSNLLPNLLKMQKENINIMFRGHDHKQALIISNTRDLSLPIIEEGESLYKEKKFEKGKRYIVSLGKFMHGSYAVYDSSKQSVKFGHMR